MPIVTYGGREFKVDDKGFLQEPDIWDEDVALLFAREQNMETLGEDHWRVIHFIRSHFLEHGKAPLIRSICNECGVTLRQLYELFPRGPVLGACRIAGLSKPDGCV